MLAVSGLHAWNGESHILHGVDFEVRRGEVVTLLGRNGVGKTTTLKSIMGMVGRRQGSVRFEGAQTIALRVAAQLGQRVVLSAPVRRITQSTSGVTVDGEIWTRPFRSKSKTLGPSPNDSAVVNARSYPYH